MTFVRREGRYDAGGVRSPAAAPFPRARRDLNVLFERDRERRGRGHAVVRARREVDDVADRQRRVAHHRLELRPARKAAVGASGNPLLGPRGHPHGRGGAADAGRVRLRVRQPRPSGDRDGPARRRVHAHFDVDVGVERVANLRRPPLFIAADDPGPRRRRDDEDLERAWSTPGVTVASRLVVAGSPRRRRDSSSRRRRDSSSRGRRAPPKNHKGDHRNVAATRRRLARAATRA